MPPRNGSRVWPWGESRVAVIAGIILAEWLNGMPDGGAKNSIAGWQYSGSRIIGAAGRCLAGKWECKLPVLPLLAVSLTASYYYSAQHYSANDFLSLNQGLRHLAISS